MVIWELCPYLYSQVQKIEKKIEQRKKFRKIRVKSAPRANIEHSVGPAPFYWVKTRVTRWASIIRGSCGWYIE